MSSHTHTCIAFRSDSVSINLAHTHRYKHTCMVLQSWAEHTPRACTHIRVYMHHSATLTVAIHLIYANTSWCTRSAKCAGMIIAHVYVYTRAWSRMCVYVYEGMIAPVCSTQNKNDCATCACMCRHDHAYLCIYVLAWTRLCVHTRYAFIHVIDAYTHTDYIYIQNIHTYRSYMRT